MNPFTPSSTRLCWLILVLLHGAFTESLWAQEVWSGRKLSQEVGIDQRLDEQLPLDTEFQDESGQTVRLGDYFRGKPVVLSFVYFRCPMLCSQVMQGMLKASQAVPQQLGRDYEAISISIDPDETPAMAAAKKKTYVSKYRRSGADQGWHFLTGDEPAIQRVADAAGFRYRHDPQTDQYAHASGILIITPEGRISRYFYGIDYSPSDLRLGLTESSEGRIGSLADRVLLLCYHYDPKTGRYGFVIDSALRTAGLMTVLVLGGFLTIMFRREAQRGMLVPAKAQSASPGEFADEQ